MKNLFFILSLLFSTLLPAQAAMSCNFSTVFSDGELKIHFDSTEFNAVKYCTEIVLTDENGAIDSFSTFRKEIVKDFATKTFVIKTAYDTNTVICNFKFLDQKVLYQCNKCFSLGSHQEKEAVLEYTIQDAILKLQNQDLDLVSIEILSFTGEVLQKNNSTENYIEVTIPKGLLIILIQKGDEISFKKIFIP